MSAEPPSAPSTSSTPADPHTELRALRERRALLVALLLMAAVLVWSRVDSCADIVGLERARLSQQASAIEQNLLRQLSGVYAGLIGTRKDLADWPEATRAERARSQFEVLAEALPGLRALVWLDARGRVLASSDAAALGRDESARAYVKTVQQRPEPAVLFVSEPYQVDAALYSLNLSVALVDAQGRYAGLLAATLDPGYFDTLLGSMLYATDMWAGVVHASGKVLVVNPPNPRLQGANLAQPGSLFLRHMASGQDSTVIKGHTLAQGPERLLAQRTLRSARLPMDRPLVVAVSRDLAAVFGLWLRQTALVAALFVAFAVASGLALRNRHRQQRAARQMEGERQTRAEADAERLALALRGGDLALWDANLPSGEGTVNARWHEMVGYRPDEIGRGPEGWQSLVHPDDLARVLALLDEHIQGRSPAYEAQYRLRHRDGHWIWVLDRGRVVERDAQGQATRVVGTHMDITARVQADQALRDTETRLRMAGRLARLGDWHFDLQAQRFSFSPEACGILGLDPAHALSAEAGLDFVLPGHRERWRAQLLQALHDGLPFSDEVDARSRDGQLLRLQVLGETVQNSAGRVVAVQGALQDVTEARRAQQQLRLLEAAVAGLNDMVVITEAEPAAEPGPPIVFVNDAFERHTGWRREEVMGRSPRLLQGPQTDPVQLARVERSLAQGQPVRAELVNHTRQGRPYWVDIAFVPLLDAQGKATHIVSVHRDISERQRADAAVRSAQEELAATLAAVPDLLYDLDAEGRIHGHHSPRAELLALPEPFIGRNVAQVLPPEAAAVVLRALRQAQTQGYSGGMQYALPLAQGQRWFELSVASKAVRPGSLPRFIALARDVTERRQAEIERGMLERQLREAQKMESIGTLAGGIAHDFNNILAAILGNVALAQGDLPAGHGALASLEQIHKAGLRARSLVQQILAFSRRQRNPLLAQPLQPMLAETLDLLRATLPASVQLHCVLPEGALWIEADATQMQQVLMNLCTNAWHALPDNRGRLEVGCEALPAAAPGRLGSTDIKPGPCAHVWVRDNGAGMDAATLERIFDPFYTTKPVGQGTGLGLSVVHGIVQGHGGAVVVDSAPGSGSTFHLYFPLAGEPAATAAVHDEQPAADAPGRGQQVLYVDDDDVMLLMVQRLLQRAGYGVTVCDKATQALECVRQEPARYALVVSDYNMPEVSGIDLARLLARLRPGLPVIISSGFVTDELREQAAAAGVRALLRKENTLEELPGLVRQVLG